MREETPPAPCSSLCATHRKCQSSSSARHGFAANPSRTMGSVTVSTCLAASHFASPDLSSTCSGKCALNLKRGVCVAQTRHEPRLACAVVEAAEAAAATAAAATAAAHLQTRHHRLHVEVDFVQLRPWQLNLQQQRAMGGISSEAGGGSGKP